MQTQKACHTQNAPFCPDYSTCIGPALFCLRFNASFIILFLFFLIFFDPLIYYINLSIIPAYTDGRQNSEVTSGGGANGMG
jgi:hypothetical protein